MEGNTASHVHTHTHIHTGAQACVGVISLTQGTGIVYFLFSQSEEIRGQRTTEEPDSTHPKMGGSGGEGGGGKGCVNGGSYQNPVAVQSSLLTSANNNVCLTKRISPPRTKKTPINSSVPLIPHLNDWRGFAANTHLDTTCFSRY